MAKSKKSETGTEADVYAALTGIFRDVFDQPEMELTSELSAQDVPGWDSFKQVEILIETEERYGFVFDTPELDSLQTVGDLVRVVINRIRS